MINYPKKLMTLRDVHDAALATDLNQTRSDSWLAVGPLSYDGHPIRPAWVKKHDADEILAERLAAFDAGLSADMTVEDAQCLFHECMA